MASGQRDWKLTEQALDSPASMCHGWLLKNEEPEALALLVLRAHCSGY